ncbi:ABC transporter ATP-binding protein [Bacillus sp. Bva_UNVM-123]|uniref:ABC transporter ATP-binding protein n=1 Tax=Bacillus sp. Bva_UNVM-123 TaxID=2829798 RepID=UPI00391F0F7F
MGSGSRPLIQIKQVSISFHHKNIRNQVLQQISLDINRGEIVSILGESGCGKSTLLNIIGGFEKADEGQVLLDGNTVNQPSRKCVMLFQDYGLLPWRSVIKNVELGLEGLKLSAAERKERALHYLDLVGLSGKEGLLPNELSGGMKQRVGIARALSLQPEVILLDEPFAALDTFNRYNLQNELLRIQHAEKTTMVLVTHDIDEAIYLSDRVYIMQSNPGHVQKELKISLSKPRDRNHQEFQNYRRIVFDHFHMNQSDLVLEYSS